MQPTTYLSSMHLLTPFVCLGTNWYRSRIMVEGKALQGARPPKGQIMAIVLAHLVVRVSVVQVLVVGALAVEVPTSMALEREAATTPDLVQETTTTTSLPVFSER